jgi:uncharacterized membrane protein (DUF2068 family)
VNRPWRNFDWNLRSCGWHGHVTYAPTEERLRERLHVDTPAGPAWRCLRCATFVPGEPTGSGHADDAPIVLRGRALRDAFILRVLAAERAVRGVLLLALAYGVYKFNGAQDSLEKVFQTYLPLLKPAADKLGIDLQSTGPVKLIEKALTADHGTLELVTFGVLAYGLLELLEAVGLWLMKRWGEYVAVVGTAIFIPLEIYEILEKVTWLRIVAFAFNVFAVVYIVWTKRLFGFRGGVEAFEAERHGESLLEVEAAAATEPARSAT